MTVLALRDGCLAAPDRLDVAVVEAQMLWPNDEGRRDLSVAAAGFALRGRPAAVEALRGEAKVAFVRGLQAGARVYGAVAAAIAAPEAGGGVKLAEEVAQSIARNQKLEIPSTAAVSEAVRQRYLAAVSTGRVLVGGVDRSRPRVGRRNIPVPGTRSRTIPRFGRSLSREGGGPTKRAQGASDNPEARNIGCSAGVGSARRGRVASAELDLRHRLASFPGQTGKDKPAKRKATLAPPSNSTERNANAPHRARQS